MWNFQRYFTGRSEMKFKLCRFIPFQIKMTSFHPFLSCNTFLYSLRKVIYYFKNIKMQRFSYVLCYPLILSLFSWNFFKTVLVLKIFFVPRKMGWNTLHPFTCLFGPSDGARFIEKNVVLKFLVLKDPKKRFFKIYEKLTHIFYEFLIEVEHQKVFKLTWYFLGGEILFWVFQAKGGINVPKWRFFKFYRKFTYRTSLIFCIMWQKYINLKLT